MLHSSREFPYLVLFSFQMRITFPASRVFAEFLRAVFCRPCHLLFRLFASSSF